MTDLVLLRYCDHSRFTIRNPLNWFKSISDRAVDHQHWFWRWQADYVWRIQVQCGWKLIDRPGTLMWQQQDWLKTVYGLADDDLYNFDPGDWWHARTATSQHPPATCVLNYKPLSQKSVCCPVSFHIIDILNCRAQFPCLIYKSNIKFQG